MLKVRGLTVLREEQTGLLSNNLHNVVTYCLRRLYEKRRSGVTVSLLK